jgi:hypothetical protein
LREPEQVEATINLHLCKIQHSNDLVPALRLWCRKALSPCPGKVNAMPRRGERLFQAAFHTITVPACANPYLSRQLFRERLQDVSKTVLTSINPRAVSGASYCGENAALVDFCQSVHRLSRAAFNRHPAKTSLSSASTVSRSLCGLLYEVINVRVWRKIGSRSAKRRGPVLTRSGRPAIATDV